MCTDPGLKPALARAAAAIGLSIGAAVLCGCAQEMADQPRAEAYEGSAFFSDGLAMRPQVPGTIARDQPWDLTPELTARRDGQTVDAIPVDVTLELLERGRSRFQIYCAHCHGPAGYGDGLVVQRGFPSPPSYHIDRIRELPEGRIFEVVTDGFGRMPAFRARIDPPERWAIVAYVRALQLSQHADVAALSDSEREKLPP